MFGYMRPSLMLAGLVGLLLIGTNDATGQTVSSSNATLSGVVRRASDAQALAGVEVWVPSQDLRTTTDSSGAYRLTGLTGGIVLVQLRRVGYDARRDTVTVVAERETHRDFVLAAQGTTLDTVRTVAGRTKYLSPRLQAFEERRATGGGRFIGDSVLRANENRPLASILLRHVPGTQLIRGPAGARYVASTRKICAGPAFTQKCRPCFASIYEDGVPIYSARALQQDPPPPPPDLNQIDNSQLTGVEFYAGGASVPPDFVHTDTGCGVLLLWTRER